MAKKVALAIKILPEIYGFGEKIQRKWVESLRFQGKFAIKGQ